MRRLLQRRERREQSIGAAAPCDRITHALCAELDVGIGAPAAGIHASLRCGTMTIDRWTVLITEPNKEAVYKIVEVVGVSEESWEEAGTNAVAAATGPCATCGSRK